MHSIFRAAVCGLVAAVIIGPPALAQKSGGVLRVLHRDTPPSASIHEEATISTVMPYASVFNNLVFFDPKEKRNSIDNIVPELATEWSWSPDNTKLTMKLREGVKWHDGKPFTAADVVCTWSQLIGKQDNRVAEAFRKNPRKVWYSNLQDITADSPQQVTFHLGRSQPSFLAFLAAGYTPIYPCHVPARVMRTAPIGTGPFKFAEYKRGELIRLVKNPDYWKKGLPYLDGITFNIIENRSTRMLSFVTGQFDLTFDSDITFPMLKDVKEQAPNAVCEARPTNVNTNLIINNAAPPFDNPKVRQALLLTLDRKTFIDILSQGHEKVGAAMLPTPNGVWGMPEEMLRELPGYGVDIEKNRAEARKIMEGLGYSAGNTLKVKVSTRNIAIYRDPAVILIDQLKHIYIEGELEPIDTAVWFSKVLKKDYSIGLNLTGVGVDDPDVNFYENFTCKSERNYTGYCNPEVEKLIEAQSAELDREKRKRIVWEVERKLVEDVARPVISHGIANTCMQPFVKNLVLQHNSIYNGWRFESVWLDK
jgi:peptide/nickel transport system substrate-binding protein